MPGVTVWETTVVMTLVMGPMVVPGTEDAGWKDAGKTFPETVVGGATEAENVVGPTVVPMIVVV